MDVSLNMIDLQYLTRPSYKIKNNFEKKDINFTLYKDRILELTKELMEGKDIDSHIQGAFDEYVQIWTQHLIFMDKAESIQADYLLMNDKKDTLNLPPMPLEETNKLVYKQARKKTMIDFYYFILRNSFIADKCMPSWGGYCASGPCRQQHAKDKMQYVKWMQSLDNCMLNIENLV